jgi:outer membrane protein assembly factor BamA
MVIAGVTVRVGEATGVPIATDEIRARLNLLEPGRRFSLQAVERNADEIQAYLRDRGYYNATVEHAEEPDPTDSTGTRRRVIYTVTPGDPTRVAAFVIDPKLAVEAVRPTLKLQPGALFTRDILGEDVNRIRQALLAKGFLSPTLTDPRVERNPDTNEINIEVTGSPGPLVNIAFQNYNLKEKTQRELLPLRREGNLDYSVIEEGARRVRNRLQEDGYFFAEITPVCTVTPPTPNTVDNGSNETCRNLVPEGLTGHTVTVTYDVTLSRRLKLADIRITGTDEVSPADIADYLKSRKASGHRSIS